MFASKLRSTNCGGLCHQPLTEECTAEQKKSLPGKVASETVLLVVKNPDLMPAFQSLTTVAATSCSVSLLCEKFEDQGQNTEWSSH